MTEFRESINELADMDNAAFTLNDSDGHTRTAQFRRLDISDLDDVYALHDLAHTLMPQPGLLAHESKHFFQTHIEQVGHLYGLFCQERLVAYTVLGLPNGPGYNFGEQFGLAPELLSKVAHCDGSVVHPDWRGNHLQQRFIDLRVRVAAQHGREHVLSTAAPLNPASWRSLIRSGFTIYKLLDMFGADRFLHYRQIGQSATIDTDSTTVVDIRDREKLLQLLNDDWIGFDYRDNGLHHFELLLARPVKKQ